MTYIRYMAVGGFKSLRDWNLLELSPRVSVLVGGNGTGKSSLVEALLWGLGEEEPGQLRAGSAADLLFHAPAGAVRAFKMEDILFHTTATPEAQGEITDTRAEVTQASVYLVMGEDTDEACADDRDEACCCKRRTDQSARELPAGSLSVGRTAYRDGVEAWELDGVAADRSAVLGALTSHGVERATVSMIRQGELERILSADRVLRARIIAEAAGLGGSSRADMSARIAELEAAREWLAAELSLGEGQAMAMVVADLAARGTLVAGADVTVADVVELLGVWPEGGDETLAVDRRAELEARLLAMDDELAAVKRDASRRSGDGRRQLALVVERVAGRAERYFQSLVPGGALRVTLHAPEVPAAAQVDVEAGVEVSVSFPGQPEVHLDALSGGQRALVAFSLGVAVFEETPSRLMVLDEVEPALDESNLRRFNELLQEIARTRQVVIVSHQRRTKDVGDVVFGVDHLGDGASGLLFRFEPATRRLVIFGRTRGNWLDRNAPELQDDDGATLAGPRSPGRTVRWGR